MMNELWITIDEAPNYAVSNLGRVKNLTSNRILNPSPGGNGYK